MISFTQQTIIITGASGGIGQASVIKMLQADAKHIALIDLKLEDLVALKDKLGSLAERVSLHPLDVSDPKATAATLDKITQEHGKINHLVHCAGIYPEALVADMSYEAWQSLMRINLDGTFNICRFAYPHLNENSSIVNLSSMAGHRGSHAHSHYAASKGAVTSFSKSLALEFAPKTRVNIVAPGIIETAMTTDLLRQKGQSLLNNTPLKRYGTADEVAAVIAFLCSDLASFVNGETIHVNGGLYMV